MTMARPRLAALTVALLGSRLCAAEAMKNHTSMGEILWAIVVLIAGVPLVIAFLMYWLVVLLKDRRPSVAATVLVALSSWWLGLFVLGSRESPAESANSATWQVVLVVALLTAVCAWVSIPSSDED
ncbi:hypothetical protein [Hymenobacter yonginensis]|uniref:Cardiolipin synthase N-terminal domain-containing protein n=1 Tax=Hymenobacter yonginensis TaxID=748197 RepID=A0ABY7PQX4_9BACT|nr:hypothetical protein [Hymenobacter yonginensis]WBO84998.1 hypothetical protein O9Z63_01855 [Hymenobacter yonginensis]